MKLFSLMFSILICTSSYAQQITCIQENWTNYQHTREKIGYSSVYLTSTDPSIQDLLCIAGSEFFKNIYNFPNKATVGILNLKASSGYLISWSLDNNLFIITKLEPKSLGISNIYTKPLKQFELLFANKPLTNPKTILQSKITQEYLRLLLSEVD